MHINYRYLLWKAMQISQGGDATILDYGCGKAEVVEEGRKIGLNIYGADVFYAGGDRRRFVEQKGLLGDAVRVIDGGIVPFPDNWFDLIVSNYVLEHVEDIDGVLKEISRLLKPGGYFLSLFPARDVWREGHCGIPFLHWFSTQSRIRFFYALVLRRLGLGHHKQDKPPAQWVEDFLEYLDRYTFYRDRQTIFESFQKHFAISLIEHDYILFRLHANGADILSRLLRLPFATSVACELFRRLAGLAVLAQKPTSPDTPQINRLPPWGSELGPRQRHVRIPFPDLPRPGQGTLPRTRSVSGAASASACQ